MKKPIKNKSVTLYAESFGCSDNTPVLLIAGAMAPAIFWHDNFCRTLSDNGYYVIRFDNRDMGRSTHFPQNAPGSGIELPYSINDMVEDAKCVLEEYSEKKAHIIGHSLGGSIAQLFILTHPKKSLSLTAISSPILAKGNLKYVETPPSITEELWSVLMSNPMHQDFEKGAPEFLRIWRYLNGDWPLDESMALTYTKSLYETEVIAPAWNHTNVQNNIRDIMDDLEKADTPILFIHGQKDYLPADPANTKILANHLPNAEFFCLKGGGHMFFNKQIWEIIADQIVNHLKKSE